MLTFIGDNLLQTPAGQTAGTHIATVFPRARVIVTLPGIHCTQRDAYLAALDADRKNQALPPLTEAQRDQLNAQAVDLILKEDRVLIRPDPDRMDLAFEADTILQECVSKRRIGFLFISDPRVRSALSRRGEAWRFHAPPRSNDDICKLIASARISAGGRAIYYYNAPRGTRILTCQEFRELGNLPDEELRRHLQEIADLSAKSNAHGYPQLLPFMVEPPDFLAQATRLDWSALPPDDLRTRFNNIAAAYQAAVTPGFDHDDLQNAAWRSRMYQALDGSGDTQDDVAQSDLLGLSAEYFLQIEWLPGARIEDGEIIFDSVSEETSAENAPSDMLVHGLICNLLQEQADLEYINIGRLVHSLSLRAQPSTGRREVYLEHFRQARAKEDTLQIIRMQKWAVAEHLDEGKDLLRAMIESEENTDYIMDRRLGCRQLGMNLSPRIAVRKVAEPYNGAQMALRGITIWSPYFQRPYVPGFASDKIPNAKLHNPRFALALAQLLGRAAAPNLILGRRSDTGSVIFDDGDEVVIEDAAGIPIDIVVADHTSTFGNYREPLEVDAPAYAKAINRRAPFLPDPGAFAQEFLEGFLERFVAIQHEYFARRRAFDALFRHRRCDPAGNLAFRWKLVLSRLEQAHPDQLAAIIKNHVTSAGPRL